MPDHAHDHGPLSMPLLAERLRRRSRKLTGPRQHVLEVLRREDHPVSARAIFEALPRGECDLATVYRSLHLLEGMGMIKHYDLGDGVKRFELLKEGDDGHHHHLICTQCSEVREIENCLMPPELQEQIADQSGFREVTHRLEFFGVCPRCQQNKSGH
jgi:Fe2+ or Zn2+ uptake regulation protein